MNRRVGRWALAGFGVACFWVLFGLMIPPDINIGGWAITAITAPATMIGRAMPLKFYWFIVLNTAIYGLVGLAITWFRRTPR